MTVLSTTNSSRFHGSGSTGPFTWTWRFLDNDDVLVYKVEDPDEANPETEIRTLLVEGIGYSLTGAGTFTGGSLTLTTALASGEDLLVERYTQALQEVDLRNQGNSFFPETHEEVFDRLTMMVQDREGDDDYTLGVLDARVADLEAFFAVTDPEVAAEAGMIVRRVSTLADLRGIVGSISRYAVYMEGRTSRGDGGGGMFYWSTSDLSVEVAADTESGVYVAPDTDPTGASGAWVRQITDRVSVLWFGADPSGTADSANAINAAIAYLDSVSGGTLVLSGTLEVTAPNLVPTADYSGTLDPLYGPLYYAAQLKSSIKLIGEGGATVKLKDNESTAMAPKNLCLFHSAETLSDIHIEGIIFNMNGTNQSLGVQLRAHHAPVMFSGPDGRATNVTITKNTFMNTDGTGVIVAGLDSSNGIGSNWQVYGNRFIDNGLGTYDHSSVYLMAHNSTVNGNVFYNSVAYGEGGSNYGCNAAAELHGPNTEFVNNIVSGCNRGVYLSFNELGAAVDVNNRIVSGNIFERMKRSFAHVYIANGGADESSIAITNNVVEFSDVDTGLENHEYVAGVIFSEGKAVKRVSVSDNIMRREASASGRTSYGVVLGAQDLTFGDITIANNTMTGLTCGLWLVGDATAVTKVLDNLSYTGNELSDPNGGTLPAQDKVHVIIDHFTRRLGTVTISDNVLVDSRSPIEVALGIAVRGSGVIDNLILSNNTFPPDLAIGSRVGNLSAPTRAVGLPIVGEINPGTINANTHYTADVAVPGAAFGDVARAVPIEAVANLNGMVFSAYVSAADTVTLVIGNVTAGNLAVGTADWIFWTEQA